MKQSGIITGTVQRARTFAGTARRALLLAGLACVQFLLTGGLVLADTSPPAKAGLVVQFGDGTVRSACVDLGPDRQATGEELLRIAGLTPVIEYSSLGGTVCKIAYEGCGFPGEACWCQCKSEPCVYWKYYRLVEGQWVYATLGASSTVLHPGDVDGWAWGAGEEGAGVLPPPMSFDEICSAAPAAVAPAPESGQASYVPVPLTSQSSQGPLSAQVALASIGGSSAPVASKTGDYAFFGGVFLIVIACAAGMRLAGPAGAGRPPLARLLPGTSSLLVYTLSAGVGVVALLYPFLRTALQTGAAENARPGQSLLLLTVLLGLCFAALLVEVQGQAISAKRIALLGVLVAINSVLRFVEVSIPGPGGFTPVFFLIVLTGYIFGGRFGFLMGALTMLVSSLITGGVGPWLPGQMFTAGWMGLIAPLARPLVRLVGGRPNSKAEIVVLAGYAGLCGLFYGVVINLWFWPFMTGPVDQYWQAGVSLADTVRRYAVYYTATSLVWDVFAVAGNVLLVSVFGAATLRALRRFHQRFDFEVLPAGAVTDPIAAVDVSDRQTAPVGMTGRALPAISLSED